MSIQFNLIVNGLLPQGYSSCDNEDLTHGVCVLALFLLTNDNIKPNHSVLRCVFFSDAVKVVCIRLFG